MCGLTGFTRPTTEAPQILSQMMKAIAHRGPDDNGQHIDDHIALGHQRLSIIDLKTGHQPMSNTQGTCWIVFNGEIYNYVELRKDLEAKGRHFRTHSDTEVILVLYETFGERCVDYLNGMFAFLIYDMSHQKVFAARDRFGMKPFYYALRASQFIFGSEIKAILRHPAMKAEVNPAALSEYILLQLCMGNKTLFKDVHKLPPAHTLTHDIGSNACRVSEYWNPYTITPDPEPDHLAEKLLARIKDSVRIQLRSDVPLGTYLSGGMDSSLITCLAADELKDRTIETFTGGFHDPGPYDESMHAKAVAASRPNLHYNEIFPTAGDFIKEFSKLIYHMDEPAAGPGLFPQFMVSRLAASKVKVVLGGQGGDELFGGYARYYLLHLKQTVGRWRRFTTEGAWNKAKAFWRSRGLLWQYSPLLRKLRWSPGASPSWADAYRDLVQRSTQASSFFPTDLITREHLDSIDAQFHQDFDRPATSLAFERALYFDFKNLLPAILQVEDRVSMAVSLESRAPLLDHRIVELLRSASFEGKFGHGEMKHLLKRAAANTLPASVLNRKDKIGFAVPFVPWAGGPLNGFLRDVFSSTRSRTRGLLKNDAILRSLGREQPYGRDLWGALCLEVWFSTFMDGKRKDATA